MKIFISFCFVFSIASSVTSSTYFRCDYNYVKSIFGYLKYHEIPGTWTEARLRCKYEGAILASPLNLDFRDAMVKMFNGNPGCGVFTGLTSLLSKGFYRSIEGMPLDTIPHEWAKFEPNNEKDDESCLAMMHDGKIADANCSDPLPFFCYRKSNRTALMSSCGTIDHEYNLDPRTGQCYKFHKTGRIWPEAQKVCSAEGGSLAIINSELEAAVLKDIFAKNPAAAIPNAFGVLKDSALIGMYRWKDDQEFLTLEGQTLTEAGYNKFSLGQPDNFQNNQYCGGIYRNALLDDVWCDRPTVFICEKIPLTLLCPETD